MPSIFTTKYLALFIVATYIALSFVLDYVLWNEAFNSYRHGNKAYNPFTDYPLLTSGLSVRYIIFTLYFAILHQINHFPNTQQFTKELQNIFKNTYTVLIFLLCLTPLRLLIDLWMTAPNGCTLNMLYYIFLVKRLIKYTDPQPCIQSTTINFIILLTINVAPTAAINGLFFYEMFFDPTNYPLIKILEEMLQFTQIYLTSINALYIFLYITKKQINAVQMQMQL